MYREALKRHSEKEAEEKAKAKQAECNLSFPRDELNQYVTSWTKRLAQKSHDWIFRSAEALWDCASGKISHTSMTELKEFALHKYKSVDSHSKAISFAKAFLKHLARLHVDQRYLSFTLFLDLPKTVKERHAVTSQIVTKEDIENVLAHIRKAEKDGRISSQRAQEYAGFVVFGAFTGQRIQSFVAQNVSIECIGKV